MQRIGQVVCLAVSILVLSCRGVEEQTLDRFFDAVRSGDHVTLVRMSVVGFSGPIESWEVIEVESESRVAFRIPELRRQQEEAKKEREQQFTEYMQFANSNSQELKMILARMDSDPDYRFQGAWGEIQKAWETFRERNEEWHRKRDEILLEIDQELKLSKMSLMSSEEIEQLEGGAHVKEVLVNVTKPEAGKRSYLFTLRKYELVRKGREYKPPSKWIITAIEESSPQSGVYPPLLRSVENKTELRRSLGVALDWEPVEESRGFGSSRGPWPASSAGLGAPG